jgi:hypothetical protein
MDFVRHKHIIKTHMLYRFLILAFFASACWACDSRSNERKKLEAEVDSLRNVIKKNDNISQTLTEVNALIDSIDVSRKMIRGKISEKGYSNKEIIARMREITNYVKASQEKIAILDQKLLGSGNSYTEYSNIIATMEKNLESRNLDLARIQQQVILQGNQNENLMHLVSLQQSEIEDKLVQLNVKQKELARLQSNVDKLLVSSTDDKAESCYARAVILEETANRTKLAPRKKRNTRLEALELYKMAAFYGSTAASAKISELEKKI